MNAASWPAPYFGLNYEYIWKSITIRRVTLLVDLGQIQK